LTSSSESIRVFLIAEVRDFTRFALERGDEGALRLVERFTAVAREVIGARGGSVIELRGDEALAVFAGARQALHAAVELQARYREETERDPTLPLRVGIGIDAGEAIPFEAGFRGRALNLAARLKDQARAGQVLATEALIHLAGTTEGLVFIERGMVHPKGFTVPVHIVEVTAPGQRREAPEAASEPELRTFLFADIQGYVAFTLHAGDAANAALQTRYAEVVERHVRAHAGRVLEVVSDTAFAVFFSTRQAILAALDMQEGFRSMAEEERWPPLVLNVGIEAGEAMPFRGKYTGTAVNLAAIICQRARGEEVLVGETARQLARQVDGLRLIDRGEIRLADETEPVRLTQVLPDR
jgi:class 3 adenylate cyclase